MIIVTGATGFLGNLIVEKLLDRLPASQIGATTRSPDNAEWLIKRGVRVRKADFEEPETLPDAFEGANQILIVSSNAGRDGGDPVAQHHSAIDAAKAAGAEKVVYTSHMGASATSKFPPMHAHAATEEILQKSDIAWTALRNGFYAESGTDLLGDFQKTQAIYAPKDGKVSWTSHSDLAEAAAAILCDHKDHQGATAPLTATYALDLSDIARIASSLTSQPIERYYLSDDEMRSKLAERHLPAPAMTILMGLFEAMRDGEFSEVDTALTKLLGRSPETMKHVISNMLGNENKKSGAA